jgi:hypothetical protein
LTEEEKCRAHDLAPTGAFVIIEPATRKSLKSSQNKNWGIDRWAQVIKEFSVPVYQFDIGDGTPLMEGVGVIRSEDFRVSAGIVERAALVLTINGGLMVLAASMGTPAVVVWGGFCDPKITGYESHVNFYSDIEGSPCGRYDDCPHCKEAMTTIKPEDVRSAALKLLKGLR